MKISDKRLTLIRLFWVFFKAGTFTFSGGLAMLPLIQKDVIDKYDMLDKETFLEYAALSQTLPGVISLNCGVFVGRKVAGVAGALAAGFGTVLPAFVAMLAVAMLLDLIPRTGLFESIFSGLRSASAALILYSAISLSGKNFKKLFPVILVAVAFVAVLIFNTNVFIVILGAAAAGLCAKLAVDKKAGGQKNTDEADKTVDAVEAVDADEADKGDGSAK